jgi:hypothetical protein
VHIDLQSLRKVWAQDFKCQKRLDYNHLVANCVLFHHVVELTRVLNQLHQEGYRFVQAAISALSPYLTGYINRFGLYRLDSEVVRQASVEWSIIREKEISFVPESYALPILWS